MQSFVRDAVPFLAMLIVECCEIGMVTIGKAAMNAGMSNLVYVVYYNGLGTLFLFPFFFIHRRRSALAPLTPSLLWRFFILGLIGFCLLQVLAYTGIKLSSPTLASALGNLIPAFTFLLAITTGMETLDLKASSSQAKLLGTVVAITGAFIVTLYKGSSLLSVSVPSPPQSSSNQTLFSQQSNWELGGALIAIECVFSSAWNILQTSTVKEYPDQTTVVFFSCFFGSIQSAVFTLIMEGNADAWIVQPGIGAAAVVYSALFGTVIRTNVITWCLNKKGPVFVAMFKPLGMIIAVIMGIMFLGDALYLGSAIGGAVIAVGFYTVMWGQAKENVVENDTISGHETSEKRTPLLQ